MEHEDYIIGEMDMIVEEVMKELEKTKLVSASKTGVGLVERWRETRWFILGMLANRTVKP